MSLSLPSLAVSEYVFAGTIVTATIDLFLEVFLSNMSMSSSKIRDFSPSAAMLLNSSYLKPT